MENLVISSMKEKKINYPEIKKDIYLNFLIKRKTAIKQLINSVQESVMI